MTRLYLVIPEPAVAIGIPPLVTDKLVKLGHTVSVVTNLTTHRSFDPTEQSVVLEVVGPSEEVVRKNIQSIHDRMSVEEAIALPSGCSVFLTHEPDYAVRQDSLLPS
mgnify:CR=1 FL=1